MGLQERPLKIILKRGMFETVNVILEDKCTICNGTQLDSLGMDCDFCSGGYVPTFLGETLLQLTMFHFKHIMSDVKVLVKFMQTFTTRV